MGWLPMSSLPSSSTLSASRGVSYPGFQGTFCLTWCCWESSPLPWFCSSHFKIVFFPSCCAILVTAWSNILNIRVLALWVVSSSRWHSSSLHRCSASLLLFSLRSFKNHYMILGGITALPAVLFSCTISSSRLIDIELDIKGNNDLFIATSLCIYCPSYPYFMLYNFVHYS